MIDRVEFGKIMAYIAAGTQKTLTQAGAEVYYDLLGDLPQEVLMIAAKRAVLDHKYATFPPVALLRDLATDAMRGEVKSMTGSEAWGIVMQAMGRCDVESPGSVERAFSDVPPTVCAAVKAFGFMSLYSIPNSSVEAARAQFIKLFESMAERERENARLPASVKAYVTDARVAAVLEDQGKPVNRVTLALAQIGKSVDE